MKYAEQDRKKGAIICQKMLEGEFFTSIEPAGSRVFSTKNLYRFAIDKDNIADNKVKNWTGPAGDALAVSQNLVNLATELYEKALYEDEEGQQELDGETALRSTEYKKFLKAIGELEKVEFLSIGTEQKIAFFLNVYQAMYVHYFLKLVEEQQKVPEDSTEQGSGLFSNIKHYFLGGSGKKFYYRIGQFDFTLDQIKHGLLRSNKKAPDAYLCSLSSSDDRLNILQDVDDARINFICLDSPSFIEHIDAIDGTDEEGLNNSLKDYVTEVLNAKVIIEDGEIVLPAVMEKYRSDFGDGSDIDLLNFVFEYLTEGDIDQETVLSRVEENQMMVTFE